MSDFPKKFGDAVDKLPPMMFDEHSCDLYDQVRPIKWHDPEFDVSYLSSVSLF